MDKHKSSIIVALAALLTACDQSPTTAQVTPPTREAEADTKTAASDKLGFQLDFPQLWNVSVSDGEVIGKSSGAGLGAVGARVSLRIEPDPNQEVSLKRYVEMQLDLEKTSLANYELIENTEYKLGGGNGYRVALFHDDPKVNLRLKRVNYYIFANDRIYNLITVSSKAEYASYAKEIDGIVSSLRLAPPGSGTFPSKKTKAATPAEPRISGIEAERDDYLARMKRAKIHRGYVLKAARLPASEYGGIPRIIVWNRAARAMFNDTQPPEAALLEVGANGVDLFDQQFKSFGVKEGYSEAIYYEFRSDLKNEVGLTGD